MDVDRDRLFANLTPLLTAHAPSGVESEVESLLRQMLADANGTLSQDAAGSLILHIAGRAQDSPVAVTAHKDEIALIVKRIEDDGRLRVENTGGLHPWAIGETPVEILTPSTSLPGVLSIGSKHVSRQSPAGRLKEGEVLTWDLMWVETKREASALCNAGVRVGSRVVIDRRWKQPIWLSDNFIAGYNLDCRAGLAILVEVALQLAEAPPAQDTYLVASSEEEIGALGAIWSVGQLPAESVIAIDVVPVATEYQTENSSDPVLPDRDRAGIYHVGMIESMRRCAESLRFGVQGAVLTSYASDATLSRSSGSAARAALIGYPGDNTHGYEICHAEAIVNCARLLGAWLQDPAG